MALGRRTLPATDKEVISNYLYTLDCESVVDASQMLRWSIMLTRRDGSACRPFKQSQGS